MVSLFFFVSSLTPLLCSQLPLGSPSSVTSQLKDRSDGIATHSLTPLLEKGATNLSPGRVINVSSVAGLDPKADNTHLGNPGEGVWSYNTSKAAANHLTKTMAVTLARKKITVNAILPGGFLFFLVAVVLPFGVPFLIFGLLTRIWLNGNRCVPVENDRFWYEQPRFVGWSTYGLVLCSSLASFFLY